MGFLKKIFIFTLFLFPLGEVIRINLGNNIILKPLDIGVVLTVFVWFIFKLINKESIKQKSILFPVFVFVLIGFFSLLINFSNLSTNHFFASSLYLLRWVTYAGIFFVVSEFDNKFKKQIVQLLIIAGSMVVGLGYIQYFFYPSLKGLIYLGWDEHMYRMFSVFLDPNFAGAFFVLFFLFILNLFFKKKSILTGLLSGLTLGAIFLTFSRSALIMLIVSSSLFFIFSNRKIWTGFMLGIVFLVLAISSKYFNIENVNLFRTISTEARLETAINAIRIIQDHPILGIGFNAYRYAQINYGFRNENAKESHADSGPDSSFLFIVATTGILGFISYFFIWFRVLKKLNILIFVSIVGIFIDSFFINSLFYTYIMFWLWVLIGATESN